MTRIFLIGYMGAGKTTLGKAYARRYGLSFLDLDWYIEERFHKTINLLFEEKGEAGFREIERNMLREVGEFENIVISPGGGTPCFFDNMRYMNGQGKTVHLKADPQILFKRLQVASQARPKLKGKTDEELYNFIVAGLEARAEAYGQAQYTFDAGQLEYHWQIDESVGRLRELLGEE